MTQPESNAATSATVPIAVLGLLVAFGPMSIDMYLPGLPAIQAEFAVSPGLVQATIAAFLAGLGFGQVVLGPLSDKYGRRPVLLVGIAVFLAATVWCALAPSIEGLLAARVIQAIGACSGTAIGPAIARDMHGPDRAAKTLSAMMMCMAVAPMIAPIIGGWMLLGLGWRAIFWALAAFGLVALLAVLTRLPETCPVAPAKPTPGGPRARFRSFTLLLWHRQTVGCALSGGLAFAGMFAYIAGTPFVFIELHGLPAEYYGLLFGLNAAGIMALSTLNGRLVERLGWRAMLRAGTGIAAGAGLLLPLLAGFGWGGLYGIAPPLFAYVAAMGIVGPNATAGGMADWPDRAGAAAALVGTARFACGGLVVILLGLFEDGTALPMALLIGVCGLSSAIVGRIMIRA